MNDNETSATAEPKMPVPPASFEYLVATFRIQTELQLGLLRLDEDQDAEPNLDAARHFIDMLAMIQEKTKGNLSLEEQRLIENSLTELRFRFVQASSSKAAKA